jgi:predicted DNA-binding transcriptional regulator AlpA
MRSTNRRCCEMSTEHSKPAALAMTIDEFCQAFSISRRMYYKLKQTGRGPREMLIGRQKRMISMKAIDAWRERCEADLEKPGARSELPPAPQSKET